MIIRKRRKPWRTFYDTTVDASKNSTKTDEVILVGDTACLDDIPMLSQADGTLDGISNVPGLAIWRGQPFQPWFSHETFGDFEAA